MCLLQAQLRSPSFLVRNLMRHSLFALCALTTAGMACAQSSVTLFGVVDVAISHHANTSRDTNVNLFQADLGSRKTSRTALTNSAYNSSRLGFRGTEDLGGGLAASFWLEAGMNNDDGTGKNGGALDFGRRSTVSLSGPFGEVRLGRDYTPTHNNHGDFDPFGTNGVGGSLVYSATEVTATPGGSGAFAGNGNNTRSSNSIGYFLPPGLGGLYGQVMYGFAENVKTDGLVSRPIGQFAGGRIGYAAGGLNVALAYSESTARNVVAAANINVPESVVKTLNLGASYDFGAVKLWGQATRLKDVVESGPRPDAELTGYLLGVTAPVGAGLLRASYGSVKYDYNLGAGQALPKAKKLALGYIHNLSKRTAIYASVARISNKDGSRLSVGGPAVYSDATGNFVPKNSTGFDLGIRHTF